MGRTGRAAAKAKFWSVSSSSSTTPASGYGSERKAASAAQLRQSSGHLRERPPGRERIAKRVLVGLAEREALILGEQPERLAHDLAVRKRGPVLHPWLDLVVALEELLGIRLGPEARECLANATVPVDERAVAVERRPAIAHRRR